jgi:hypothetical protein
MSAINPASFASPSLGLQAPSGIGPGAVGVGRTQQGERRQQQDQPQSFGAPPQPNRGAFGGAANAFPQQPFPADRPAVPSNGFSPTAYTYGYSPFNASPRSAGGGAAAASFVPMMDPLANFPDYQGLPGRFPSPHGSGPGDAPDYARQSSALGSPNEGWISSFQGLSMNSR